MAQRPATASPDQTPGAPPRPRWSTRRTNVGLLVALVIAFTTGWFAFGFGTSGAATPVLLAHAVAGFTIAALSPWKSVVVRRGLGRERRGRDVSILLAFLVVTVVVTGLAHAAGLRGPFGGITTMQVHVGAALAAVPLAVWHALARPSRPRRADLSRRSLLRAGRVVGVAGLAYALTESLWILTGAPGADRRFTGSYELGSGRPESMPVTQWLFDAVPDADLGGWEVEVVRVARTERVPAADLPTGDGVRAILDCTGGWYAEQDWEGVRLDRLLGDPGDARSVLVRSSTGYTRRLPVSDLDRLWLATRCGGAPLSRGHGAPVRLVAPGRRGFWWVKWVDRVALDPAPPWAQPPFPLQ